MGYKILGKELVSNFFYVHKSTGEIYKYEYGNFICVNKSVANVVVPKRNYHKFTPYWLQKGDLFSLSDKPGIVREVYTITYEPIHSEYTLAFFASLFDATNIPDLREVRYRLLTPENNLEIDLEPLPDVI